MTPEQLARIEIDRQLIAAGWVVQDHRSMNIRANLGVAVREFPLDTGPVDYLLYAGKVIGMVEAKPERHIEAYIRAVRERLNALAPATAQKKNHETLIPLLCDRRLRKKLANLSR